MTVHGFILPQIKEERLSVWAQYSILANNKQQRDDIVDYLKKHNINVAKFIQLLYIHRNVLITLIAKKAIYLLLKMYATRFLIYHAMMNLHMKNKMLLLILLKILYKLCINYV